MGDIQTVQRKPGGVEFLIMASNAVGVDERLGIGTGRSLRRGFRWSLCMQSNCGYYETGEYDCGEECMKN
jgi:hypothetical protein